MDTSRAPYHKFTLGNGVRLLLLSMEGVDSIATCVMVAAGSRYETSKISGISHFLEHMVFKGTKKFPSTDDVNIVERIGGLQNAYTDVDTTNYHNKVLGTDWKLALDVNRELATEPLLLAKHVDRERNVILEEMKRYEDEPEQKVEETFHQLLYPGTRLGMRIIGEETSLRAVDAKKLRVYHDEWYTPDRIVVVLVGKIAQYQVSSIKYQVEKWLGELTGRNQDGLERIGDQQKKPRVAAVTKPDVQQAHLVLGLRTFARASQDRFGWHLFNLLMGVSFTSRLFKEIREKRGLCYHIHSNSNNWADVGNWSIHAGVATEKVAQAVKAILAELAKVAEKGVTEEEMEVARKRLKTLFAFKSEDPEFLVEYYGRQELFGLPFITIDDYIKRTDAVTKAEVDSLVRRYIKGETLNLALVWSRGSEEKLEQLLKL